MADKNKALKDNVPGRFFVDSTCINCDNCRDVAPGIFGEAEDRAVVARQPVLPEEIELTELALLQCPRGAIGSYESVHIDVAGLNSRFPLEIEDRVFWLGYNSPKTYGGKSYFVQHPDGNWMIDGPKFKDELVTKIESLGGLKYIFLTHRDDVGDSDKYAQRFGAKRIIHSQDLCAQPDAEIVLGQFEKSTEFGSDFLLLFTPGHTEGHCMLLYRNKFLFSGDVLTSRARFDEEIEVWSPRYCWYDWKILTESVRMLTQYDFEWLLPGHGRRTKVERHRSRDLMQQAVARAEQEQDIEPVSSSRLEVFEAVARFAIEPEQKERYRLKAQQMRAALSKV